MEKAKEIIRLLDGMSVDNAKELLLLTIKLLDTNSIIKLKKDDK